jgi:hypothetical protein
LYCGSECDEDLDMVSWPSRPGRGMASCYSYDEGRRDRRRSKRGCSLRPRFERA